MAGSTQTHTKREAKGRTTTAVIIFFLNLAPSMNVPKSTYKLYGTVEASKY